MEVTCSRCHQTVQPEDCFCPFCGLPQLVYTADGLAVPGQPERTGEPVRDAGSVDWKAALRLAETVTRDAHVVSDEQFAELRSFYSEGEIVELLCAIGLFNYFNRFNNALRMEPTKPGEGGVVATEPASASA